jgi:hypothetical protein
LIIMIKKSIICASFLFVALFLFTSSVIKAQDTAGDAFKNYTNPHDVCNYYRTQSNFTIVRVSDTECLVSLGEGQFTTYTQYYYSGDQWCYRLTQRGQTQYSNCIPIPHSSSVAQSVNDSFDNFFKNLHIDSKNEPYIFAGVAIVILAIVLSVTSAAHRAHIKTTTEPVDSEQEKTFNPKVKRSGKGGYGWEEMETTTTEDFNAKPPTGPEEGQSQGGIGLHDEPVVKSTADELEKLVKLKKQGVLSDKEFDLAKKKLLG